MNGEYLIIYKKGMSSPRWIIYKHEQAIK